MPHEVCNVTHTLDSGATWPAVDRPLECSDARVKISKRTENLRDTCEEEKIVQSQKDFMVN